MGILNKGDELQAIVDDLATKLEAAETELLSLREFKAKSDKMEQLKAKSEELGFEGDLTALYDDDASVAMSNLITAYTAQLSDRQESFKEDSLDEDDGDAADGVDDFVAHNKGEAIDFVKMQYDLKGRDAVTKAKELFSDLWG